MIIVLDLIFQGLNLSLRSDRIPICQFNSNMQKQRTDDSLTSCFNE